MNRLKLLKMATYPLLGFVYFSFIHACFANSTNAEFGGMCTVGLATGKKVKTDCKISTIFDQKTYCFGDMQAQAAFLNEPQKYVTGAKKAMLAERKSSGEAFEGMCTTGLAEGRRIQTDCKITSTFENKTYCFSTKNAKQAFLAQPKRHLERAKDHYAAGTVASTAKAMGKFGADDVKAWIDTYIQTESNKNNGIYYVYDSLTSKKIPLKYQKLDFMRTLHGYGFFPEVIFSATDNPDKKYLIDFWVKPSDGELQVFDVRIYKSPKKRDGEWSFVKRQPKPWWWIPASEHPGETEEKRSWEVMSAIEEHVVISKTQNNGLYILKDEKTGQDVKLEFIGVHQPVRKLKETGKYFACTDFRKKGSKNEIYDIDFWLDESTGDIKVGSVRVHKVPSLRDGEIIQIPRYNHDPSKTTIVP